MLNNYWETVRRQTLNPTLHSFAVIRIKFLGLLHENSSKRSVLALRWIDLSRLESWQLKDWILEVKNTSATHCKHIVGRLCGNNWLWIFFSILCVLRHCSNNHAFCLHALALILPSNSFMQMYSARQRLQTDWNEKKMFCAHRTPAKLTEHAMSLQFWKSTLLPASHKTSIVEPWRDNANILRKTWWTLGQKLQGEQKVSAEGLWQAVW